MVFLNPLETNHKCPVRILILALQVGHVEDRYKLC